MVRICRNQCKQGCAPGRKKAGIRKCGASRQGSRLCSLLRRLDAGEISLQPSTYVVEEDTENAIFQSHIHFVNTLFSALQQLSLQSDNALYWLRVSIFVVNQAQSTLITEMLLKLILGEDALPEEVRARAIQLALTLCGSSVVESSEIQRFKVEIKPTTTLPQMEQKVNCWIGSINSRKDGTFWTWQRNRV